MSIVQILLVTTAVVVGVSLAGLLVFMLVRVSRRQSAARREAWQAVALRTGGELHPPAGPWYRRTSTTIEAEVAGIRVVLDTYAVTVGQTTMTYTRASADGPAGRRFQVTKRHALSDLGRALGAQDVELGEHLYDRTFVVKTDDPAWLQAKLPKLARERHLQRPEVHLSLEKGRIRAVVPGSGTDPDLLHDLIDLAGLTSRALA
jgi:hypothetical protein